MQLLLGSGLMTREEYARANALSEDEKIPLIVAVKNNTLLTEDSLRLSQEAQQRVMANEISSDLAIRALRIALQRRLSLVEAIKSVQKLHQQTQVSVSATNELTALLLSANFITMEQLGRFIKLSADSGMMVGHLLQLDNRISIEELLNGLNAVVMIRDGELDKSQAAQGLRFARQRRVTIEQALFEVDFLKNLKPKNLRIGELFLMAGLITREDFGECFEIELFKSKPFGQILLERGLVTAQQAHSAGMLTARVEEGTLLPYQAARMLIKVVRNGELLSNLVSSGIEQASTVSLLDLVSSSGAADQAQLQQVVPGENASWSDQGAALFKAGILDADQAMAALRLKALTGLGYITPAQAIEIFSECIQMSLSLEDALVRHSLNLPTRVQWTWVQAGSNWR